MIPYHQSIRTLPVGLLVALLLQAQVPSRGITLKQDDGSQATKLHLTAGSSKDPTVEKDPDMSRVDSSLDSWWTHQVFVRTRALAMNDDLMVTPIGKLHPCWNFEWWQLKNWMVYFCCVVLFFAGILCSAGGIGGGGVYVTVLMVAGGLPIEDAVPLSKSIVFSGSLASLFLNLKKSFSSGESLIDYNICRLVIPGALVGTYVGVLLNSVLPGWAVSMILTLVLLFITTMVTRTVRKQWVEEKAAIKAGKADTASAKQLPTAPSPSGTGAKSPTEEPSGTGVNSSSGTGVNLKTKDLSVKGNTEDLSMKGKDLSVKGNTEDLSMKGKCTKADMTIWFVCLLVVIFFSVFRFHAGRCQHALPAEMDEKCNHPVMGYFGKGTLKRWMLNDASALTAEVVSFVIPIATCLSALFCYTLRLMRMEGWIFKETMLYSGMACTTGILAGLVGIGGGLIFSPFFLVVGIDPAVAVATSSTCVIFTSSSTTLQYLLTDRIIMGLTVIYGTVNLVASYVGTKCVHYAQDRWGARKSFISLIVLAGVGISLVLAIIKFAQKIVEETHHGAISQHILEKRFWTGPIV